MSGARSLVKKCFIVSKWVTSPSHLPDLMHLLTSQARNERLQKSPGIPTSLGKKGVDTSIDLSSGLPDCELPSSFNAGGAVSTSDSIDKDNNRGGDDSNPVSVSDYTTESVSARCIAVHPLGNQIACGDKKGKVRVFDLRTMRERISMNAHAAEVLTLNYAPVCETVRRGVDDDNNNSDDWDVVIDPNQKSHGDTKRISLLLRLGATALCMYMMH